MPLSRRKVVGTSRSGDNDTKTFENVLVGQLMSLRLCSSDEEYLSVAEAIACSSSSSTSLDEAPPSKEDLDEIVSTLVDYFEGDVGEEDAKTMIHSVVRDVWGEDFADNLGWIDTDTVDTDEEHDEDEGDENESDGDDGDFVGEGECLLCERTVKLTRHHLIPKTTWPRIKKRLWNAASTIEKYHSLNDESSHEKNELQAKLEKTLGMTDISDIPRTISHDSVRTFLVKVCLLCRPCHSKVHGLHTEMELATQYNTVEKLFADEEILKFGKWASKQRPGKYAV